MIRTIENCSIEYDFDEEIAELYYPIHIWESFSSAQKIHFLRLLITHLEESIDFIYEGDNEANIE